MFVGPMCVAFVFFFLMMRRPPRSTLDRSSAASDVYKRQATHGDNGTNVLCEVGNSNGGSDHVECGVYSRCDGCLLYTSPSPRDRTRYRMPSSA